MDAFYASVEQADNESYRGKPVIVGARPGKRGVVSACSYEAREYGIHSAMPISQALRLCKEGIYVPVHMKRYQEVSRRIMTILDDFSPEKTQISIDEAFLNMSGMEKIFPTPREAALKLKKRIKRETGLTISVGIAQNRLLAKIASDFHKPDGLVEIKKGEELGFLDTIQLKDIGGLGKKTLENLQGFNIRTVKQLRAMDRQILQRIVGKSGGLFLYNAARGVDPGIYSRETKTKSISTEVTFREDTKDKEGIHRTLLDLSDQIMFRLMEQGYKSRTVFIKIRYGDFKTVSAQTTRTSPLRTTGELFKTALQLFEKKWDHSSAVRLIGMGVSSVEIQNIPDQIQLFPDSEDQKSKVEKAILSLRAKGSKIVKASLMKKE